MPPRIQICPPGNAVPQTEPSELYPASLAQRRLWFLDRLQEATASYNVHVGLWLYGPLNLTHLQASLQEVVNRHDTLRTCFRLEGNELVQVVSKHSTVTLNMTDFADVAEPYPHVYELAKQEVETPFDLSIGPLFRTQLFRIAAEEHVLLCTMHHTITDASSMQVFVKELAVLYDQFQNSLVPDLPQLPIRYGDYAEWQLQLVETQDAQRQLEYWKNTLRDAPPVLELPRDGPRPAEQSLQGASHAYPVPKETVASISSLAARYHVTPFMFLLAAFKVLLYRYSGETDLLVGVPVSGRNQVETEGLIGLFVNTLVLRDDLSGNPRFLDLLAQVRATTLGALANAETPFEKIVDAVQPERNLSYNPMFQVMFSFIKSAIRSHAFGNVSSYPYVVDTATSIVDLSATIIEDSDAKWWLHLEYNTDLFRTERIARLVEDYVTLLGAVAAQPEIHIDELGLATSHPKPSRRKGRGKVKSASMPDSSRPEAKPLSEPLGEEEMLLARIWADVLGVPKVGTHDNFFDVGGHSLLAARLMAQILEVTGQKIPVSAIFRAPTIAGLASLIRSNNVANPEPPLVKLNDGNSGIPFFAVAAPGVDSLGLALLARQLNERHPVYKLQGNGPGIGDRPFGEEELQTLAREHVAAMRSAQPTGPYCLGGMCDGVLIAQQIILELESKGEEVALFAVLDTWVLENSRTRPLWAVHYYLHRLRTLRNLPLKEQLATARRVSQRLLGGNESAKHEWRRAYWPDETFTPPKFHAPVLLFKRPRQPYYRVRDPQMGWGARSHGGVDICEIKCRHFEVLRPPHVQIVSQRLAERLQQISQRVNQPSLLSPVISELVTSPPGTGAQFLSSENCQA